MPPCDSTPLDWCSWITAVICLPTSTDRCEWDNPLDPNLGDWPYDISSGELNGTYYYYIDDETDSVQLASGSGYINFTIGSYHDSCMSVYRVADFDYDGTALGFDSWNIDSMNGTWTDAQMANNTVSDEFTLSTGKDISFYREFMWYDPLTGEQLTNNYLSLDTLAYTVELLKASDNSRLAVLDTMSVLRRTTKGVPQKYGQNPILSTIHYTVPASLNNVDAYIRVVPQARGNGDYKFGRYDYVGFELSDRPTTSEGTSYISTFGAGMPRTNPTWQSLVGTTESYELTQLTISSDRVALMRLSGRDASEKPVSFIVTDEVGRTWTDRVKIVSGVGSELTVECSFPSSGVFFVAAYREQRPIAVHKALVK